MKAHNEFLELSNRFLNDIPYIKNKNQVKIKFKKICYEP